MRKNYKLIVAQGYNHIELEFVALVTAMKEAENVMEHGVKGTIVTIERIDADEEVLKAIEEIMDEEDFTKDEVEL